VNYSTALKKGDRVLVDATDVPDEFVVELMRASGARTPLRSCEVRHSRITREILRETTRPTPPWCATLSCLHEKSAGLRSPCAAAPTQRSRRRGQQRMSLYARVLRPLVNYRVNHTRWVVLRWPTPSMAQGAG